MTPVTVNLSALEHMCSRVLGKTVQVPRSSGICLAASIMRPRRDRRDRRHPARAYVNGIRVRPAKGRLGLVEGSASIAGITESAFDCLAFWICEMLHCSGSVILDFLDRPGPNTPVVDHLKEHLDSFACTRRTIGPDDTSPS